LLAVAAVAKMMLAVVVAEVLEQMLQAQLLVEELQLKDNYL
jgi:hypothetical protein